MADRAGRSLRACPSFGKCSIFPLLFLNGELQGWRAETNLVNAAGSGCGLVYEPCKDARVHFKDGLKSGATAGKPLSQREDERLDRRWPVG